MPLLKNFYKLFYFFLTFLLLSHKTYAQSDWYEKDSEHFKIIYRIAHKHLVDHILNCAESSYSILSKYFNNNPDTPIIINTYDINDYGFGAATTVPENFIRLEIEPFEPGYENTPYNERFQWVLNHELVHIFVNDAASNVEMFQRNIFGKVAPVQIQPLTILYSLGGNFNRYTPRWHQEALAVYLETWLSGGFGRILGSFDEMYFRAMTADSVHFPTDIELETILSHNSFLLEQLFYLYGGRFAAYLSIQFDSEHLLEWFKTEPQDFYSGYRGKFKKVFNQDFDFTWNDFIKYEQSFQKKNIQRINSSPVTSLSYLTDEPLGWVTQPYFFPQRDKIIFADHRPHNLAGVKILDIKGEKLQDLVSVPSPSMYQVTSTAFDSSNGLFFYTTNNNQLYRDLRVVDAVSGESKLLFPDARTGQLTASPLTHELWGIQHWSGKASLVYTYYPYSQLYHIKDFEIGEEVLNLSIDPTGEKLAAVVHRSSGKQELLIIDVNELKKKKEFASTIISDKGEPDNPSWSPDSRTLLWNASVNGVSNIFSYNFDDSVTIPLTNTVKGLFKPIFFDPDTIFAFEFSTEGFYPVKFQNAPAQYLPAIEYLGEKIVEKEKHLADLIVDFEEPAALPETNDETGYASLSGINLNTFIPVVTGFQKQAALGFFAQLSDPLINHDITAEIAYSPFSDSRLRTKIPF